MYDVKLVLLFIFKCNFLQRLISLFLGDDTTSSGIGTGDCSSQTNNWNVQDIKFLVHYLFNKIIIYGFSTK